MNTTLGFFTRTTRLLLAALLVLLVLPFSAQPARAATITISNQANCEALGGEIIDPACRFYVPLNIAAGDVLEILMLVQLAREATFDGTVNIRSGGTLEAYLEATNNGTITVAAGGKLQNHGQSTFTNNGTIIVNCGGLVVGTITGNSPQIDDCTPPNVTVNQAAGQADPTSASPINFVVVFSEPVSGFDGSDVSLSGTAGATTAVVSGGPASYSVAVSGMTNNGTVIATIPANAALDGAGFGNTASTSSDNTVTFISDSTAPNITPNIVGTLGSNGWYVSDVVVSWSVVDNESTISSQTGCGSSTVNSDTTGATFNCSATSAGGTTSVWVDIVRDATAPGISFVSRTAPNANGWNNTDVTLNWSCADATSGAVSGSISQTVGSEGANQSSTGTCLDLAGNSASNMQSGINIDKTAPTLAPVVSPNPIPLGGSAAVSSNASDALSGIASQSCGAVDTSTVGNKTVACTATDNAGNTASANASYQVVYTFAGFFSPVDNLPILNSAKAGSAIPVKFSLNGNQGLNIFAAGYPKVQQIACDSSAPGDEIEVTVTSGSSGLQYDPATDTYTYVWKTQKNWAGTCRQLIVRLNDGTDHIANFKFK